MSKVILRAKRFLNLFLTTSSNQQQALLHTATPDQVFAICEIFYNLQHMKLSPKATVTLPRIWPPDEPRLAIRGHPGPSLARP